MIIKGNDLSCPKMNTVFDQYKAMNIVHMQQNVSNDIIVTVAENDTFEHLCRIL